MKFCIIDLYPLPIRGVFSHTCNKQTRCIQFFCSFIHAWYHVPVFTSTLLFWDKKLRCHRKWNSDLIIYIYVYNVYKSHGHGCLTKRAGLFEKSNTLLFFLFILFIIMITYIYYFFSPALGKPCIGVPWNTHRQP